MKKKIIIFIVLALLSVATFLFLKKAPEEMTPTKKETKQIEVLVIGENVRFKSSDKLTYTFSTVESLKNTLPKERFILLRDEEQVDASVLKTLVEKKKVVLFYGVDVLPEKVKEKIGMEFDITKSEFKSTIPFNYHLFGFGFSTKYNANIKWELQGNDPSDLEASITAFLEKYAGVN